MTPVPSLLHNNSKRRRFHRDLAKALKGVGPSGSPHPWGNREYRRSKQGKAEIFKRLQAETMALREMFATLKEEKDVVDGQVSSEA
jgi:hypothetical protein